MVPGTVCACVVMKAIKVRERLGNKRSGFVPLLGEIPSHVIKTAAFLLLDCGCFLRQAPAQVIRMLKL